MNFDYRNGNIHWMNTPDTPGKRIRALRLAKGLTQVMAARLARIDQSTLSDIENDRGLSAEYLMRLCDVLASEPQYIMRGTSSVDDVLQKIKALVSQPQNENFSLADVSNQGKPPASPPTKAGTLNAVNAGKTAQLNSDVRQKLVGNKGASNERGPAQTQKKPRSNKAS